MEADILKEAEEWAGTDLALMASIPTPIQRENC
jgi:hypothetical protein